MTCEACETATREVTSHENCTDWREVPADDKDRRILEAIFGPNIEECCCQSEGRDGGNS